MKVNLRESVEILDFSARTTNALIRNGVLTVQDILNCSDSDFKEMRGLGAACFGEIKAFFSGPLEFTEESIPKAKTMTFGEFWKEKSPNERNFDVVSEFYNNALTTTLQETADKFSITRERVRQIVKKATNRFEKAYKNGIISYGDNDVFLKRAEKKTEVHMLGISDEVFSSVAIAAIIAAISPDKFEIFKDSRLNGEWLVKKDDNVKDMFNVLYDELHYRSEPLKLSEIGELYAINEDMALSIKGAIEKDGFITLEKNKKATGNDKNVIVEDLLEALVRPATTFEIVERTGFPESTVRGIVARRNLFQNVGKSIYDLLYRTYEDTSVAELSKKILVASNRALCLDEIYRFVKIHSDISEEDLAFELENYEGIYKRGNQYFLDGWGMEKIETIQRKKYEIPLLDAVFQIVNETDEVYDYTKVAEKLEEFGDAVSHNPNSVKMMLARLSDSGKIKRVGSKQSGCYVRISNQAQNNEPNQMRLFG